MTTEDLKRYSIQQLERMLAFHESDRGTMTFEEECRRMWFCQNIPAELDRRQSFCLENTGPNRFTLRTLN